MANKSLHMDEIKRLFELKSEGCSIKKIARIMGLSKNTVRKYLRMGAGWPGLDGNQSLKDGMVVSAIHNITVIFRPIVVWRVRFLAT